MAYRNLAVSMDDVPAADFDRMAELCLAACRAHRALDDTDLDYYRVRRCVQALAEGAEDAKVWQHPLIVQDLLRYIRNVTGIQVSIPACINPCKAGALCHPLNGSLKMNVEETRESDCTQSTDHRMNFSFER